MEALGPYPAGSIVVGDGSTWNSVFELVSAAAALAALLGAGWGLIQVCRRIWRASIGSRRHQRRLIGRLFPGAHRTYIEGLLGPPTLVARRGNDSSVRRYRLPDCWISVGYRAGAAEWVSVTVTDRRFSVRTRDLTQGLIDVRLGRDSFEKATTWFHERGGNGLSIGQKEQSYVELCDGPTAHRSQKALLAYTNLGSGVLRHDGPLMSPKVIRDRTTITSFCNCEAFRGAAARSVAWKPGGPGRSIGPKEADQRVVAATTRPRSNSQGQESELNAIVVLRGEDTRLERGAAHRRSGAGSCWLIA